MKRYLFAGASSQIAIATAQLLQAQGHEVIGLSHQADASIYDAFYTVENYEQVNLPHIEGELDGLVYFPGTINLKPFHRLSTSDFLNDYTVNSLGAVEVTQAYLPNLKNGSTPSIVYLSSVAATVGMPFHASIAMAKGALEALTRSLAAELAPKIRVNCIAPSLTDTRLGSKLLSSPEKFEASQNRNPMKKVGKASEIASAIHFLLSTEAAWITGQILNVDGGMNSLKNT